MNQDIIVTLFKYYSKFVSKEVLRKMFKQVSRKSVGYDEVVADILSQNEDAVIPDIDAYIYSANERFVSEKIPNSDGTILFVEYGAFSYDPTSANGISEKLAVHIACPYTMTNNDNMNEALIMNRMYAILCSILDAMQADQSNLNFCGTTKLVNFPVEIVSIDPSTLYDRIGFMAMFDYSTTDL
ncbi:MAG: hypothetical protein QM654_12905 [Dysgonamonadaceae bacterium]